MSIAGERVLMMTFSVMGRFIRTIICSTAVVLPWLLGACSVTDESSIGASEVEFLALSESLQPKDPQAHLLQIDSEGGIAEVREVSAANNSQLLRHGQGIVLPTDQGIVGVPLEGEQHLVNSFDEPGPLTAAAASANGQNFIFAFNGGLSESGQAEHILRFGRGQNFDSRATSSHPFGLTACDDGTFVWVEDDVGGSSVHVDGAGDGWEASLPVPYEKTYFAKYDCDKKQLDVLSEVGAAPTLHAFQLLETRAVESGDRHPVEGLTSDIPQGLVSIPTGILSVSRSGEFALWDTDAGSSLARGALGIEGDVVQAVFPQRDCLAVLHLEDSDDAELSISLFAYEDFSKPIWTQTLKNSSFTSGSEEAKLVNGEGAISSLILVSDLEP